MATRSTWLVGAFLAVIVFSLSMPAMAEEGTSYIDGSMRKLGRGIANIATCPAEVIRTPELVSRKEGYLASITIGLVEGVWRTLLRGVTGVFEVATFYADIPKGFAPLMTPEFVWEHGNWTE